MAYKEGRSPEWRKDIDNLKAEMNEKSSKPEVDDNKAKEAADKLRQYQNTNEYKERITIEQIKSIREEERKKSKQESIKPELQIDETIPNKEKGWEDYSNKRWGWFK